MSQCKQAVLLAAGRGSRLGALTAEVHKCMVPVAGVPIVDNLVDHLEAMGVTSLVVATGHLHDVLDRHLRARERRIDIELVHNERYDQTNNIFSLWLTRDRVEPPFMLLECDVFLDISVLEPLSVPDRMIVSRYEDDMSGSGVEVGDDGIVRRLVLGRDIQPAERSTLKKTVNLTSLSDATWNDHLCPAIGEWVAAGRVNDFYEAALGERIARGLRLEAIDVTDRRWIEIDTAEDLARAEQMFGSSR